MPLMVVRSSGEGDPWAWLRRYRARHSMRLRAQKVVALAAEIVWVMRFTEDTPEALQTMWADIRAIATQAIKDMGESEERGESEQPG